MYTSRVFCSHWGFIQWLQNHLLACPFKQLTGIDCPGCGFQRSVLALARGQLGQSLQLYPATIPLFAVTAFVLLDCRCRFDKRHTAKKGLYIVTGTIIICSYVMKMTGVMPAYH
jgi:hypothetical protein